MDSAQIIELLRDDMRGEHQAIIQYLNHAYRLSYGVLGPKIETIAREEMRHLEWLGDAITELGGDPTMERATVDFEMASDPEQLRKDVVLEEHGIAQYQAHIDAIPDEAIRRLLSRIVHDEQVHHGEFIDLAQQAEDWLAQQPTAEADAAPAAPPQRVVDILNQGVRHEYTVILQYLFHSFMAEDKEISEELQMAAINEMQHMGWLSEGVADEGMLPDMQHTQLFLSHDTEQNLQADISVEQEVTRDYSAQLSEINDEELKALVARIRDHEIYHDARFKDLLAELRHKAAAATAQEAPAAPVTDSQQISSPKPPSVGSLIGKK